MQKIREGFEQAYLFFKSAIAAVTNWKTNTCWEQTYRSIKEKHDPNNKSAGALKLWWQTLPQGVQPPGNVTPRGATSICHKHGTVPSTNTFTAWHIIS